MCIVATRVVVVISNVRLSAPPEDRKERPADITGRAVGGPRTMTGPTFMSQTVAHIPAFQGSPLVWLLHISEWLALIDKHQERQHFWFWKALGFQKEEEEEILWQADFWSMWVGTLVPLPSDKLNPIETNELWHWEGIEVHKPAGLYFYPYRDGKEDERHTVSV